MQLSPHALPFEQTLQHAANPAAAHAGDAQVKLAGPTASDAVAIRTNANFMATLPRFQEDADAAPLSRVKEAYVRFGSKADHLCWTLFELGNRQVRVLSRLRKQLPGSVASGGGGSSIDKVNSILVADKLMSAMGGKRTLACSVRVSRRHER
jgi:hypothetical protein